MRILQFVYYDLCFYLGRLFLTYRLSEIMSCSLVLAVESVDYGIFLMHNNSYLGHLYFNLNHLLCCFV